MIKLRINFSLKTFNAKPSIKTSLLQNLTTNVKNKRMISRYLARIEDLKLET